MPMTTITDEQKVTHMRATIQAGLDAAWLQRVGPTGDSGEWYHAEFLQILDHFHGVDLDLYPSMVYRRPDDMPHADFLSTHCGWSWYFKFRVDEENPSEEERALIHSLQALDWHHGCDGRRGFIYTWDDDGDFPMGFDTKAKPEVPEAVVQAALLLAE
jgi:hypothetical protein